MRIKTVITLYIFFCVSLVFGQENITIEHINRLIPGKIYDFYVSGNYCYLSIGSSLNIIDITAPSSTNITGSVDVGDVFNTRTSTYSYDLYNIVISEGIAFVQGPSRGLIIIDVSDPTSPEYLCKYNSEYSIKCIYVKDNYVFLVSNSETLEVLDISDIENPVKISEYSSDSDNSYIRDIKFYGDYIYYSTIRTFLKIIDITEPENPSLVACIEDSTKTIENFCIKDNLLFTILDHEGLEIYDISNPEELSIVNTNLRLSYSYTLEIYDNKLFAEYWNRLEIYDISNLDTVALVHKIQHESSIKKMHLSDYGLFYLDNASSIYFYNIPQTQPQICTVSNIKNIRSIITQDSVSFVISDSLGLVIFDITDPHNIEILSCTPSNDIFLEMKIKDNYLYTSTDKDSFFIIDISSFTEPEIIGRYDFSSGIMDFGISNQYAIFRLQNNSSYLTILDISTPSSPVLYREVEFQRTYNFYIENNLIFARTYSNDFNIFEISDSLELSLLTTLETGGHVSRYFIRDNYVYIANNNDEIYIYDIESMNLCSVLYINFSNQCNYLYADNNYLYVSDRYYRIHVVDISDPYNPVYSYDIDPDFTCTGFTSEDSILFLVNSNDGFSVVNNQPSRYFRTLGSYIGVSNCEKIAAHDNILYVFYYNNSFVSIDYTDINNPQLKQNGTLPYTINNICFSDEYAFYTCNNGYIYLADINNIGNLYSNYIRTNLGNIKDFKVIEDYLYIADDSTGFAIYKQNSSNRIELIGFCPIPGGVSNVEIKGQYAYCSDSVFGFYVIDISDPNLPIIINHRASQGITDFKIYENTVTLKDSQGDIGFLDTSNPFNLKYFQPNIQLSSAFFEIQNQTLFLCSWYGTIKVYDISTLRYPKFIASLSIFDQVEDVLLDSDFLFIATNSNGIHAYNISSLQEEPAPYNTQKTIKATPNPFKENVTLRLPDNTEKIEIFDINGRLCHSADITGYYLTYTWQPLDNTPNGVYYIKAFSDSNSFSGKVVYIK